MKIAVIGGGIGGLTAAGLLYQTGHDVQVYEKRNDLNQVGAGIGIGSNVLKALKPYKMTYAIEQEGQALNKIEIRTNLDSFLNTLKMNQDEEQNITIHRSVLHEILKTHVPPERINLDYKLKEFKQTPDNIRLYFENGQEAEADLVIAADGLNSNIRKQIQPKSEPKYAGYTCFRGVVNENLNIDRTTALEYWGHKGRFGIVPLKDDELYCNVLDAQEELGILHHDMYDLTPLKSFISGRVVLLGDAAHATTPNMGQGAGQAIEDAVTLTNLLKEKDVDAALKRYNKLRVKHTRKVIKKSRKIGKAGQASNTMKIKMRNKMLKSMSSKSLSKKVKFLQKAKLK